MKGAMVMVLGQASAALFTCVEMLTGHEHWSLEPKESEKLGEVLDKALATLPERAYETVIAIADKWYPWVQLVFVLAILIYARIEESAKIAEGGAERAEGAGNQASDAGANGSGRHGQTATGAHYRPYHTSLGYDN